MNDSILLEGCRKCAKLFEGGSSARPFILGDERLRSILFSDLNRHNFTIKTALILSIDGTLMTH